MCGPYGKVNKWQKHSPADEVKVTCITMNASMLQTLALILKLLKNVILHDACVHAFVRVYKLNYHLHLFDAERAS